MGTTDDVCGDLAFDAGGLKMKMEDDNAAESSAALLDPSVDIFVVFGGGYVELNSGGRSPEEM